MLLGPFFFRSPRAVGPACVRRYIVLSRPRRFGKSLFLDTCKELFGGNEALFEGLAIHRLWDWSVRHPVVRLSFGSGNFKEPDHLNESLLAYLTRDPQRVASVLGTGVTVEDSSRGRADMAVRAGGRVCLFEFKVVEQAGPGTALAQLKARAYADKYRALGEPVHLVGVEFSRASRNVVAFDHEIA